MSGPRRRAVMTLATVAIVIGIVAALLNASSPPFETFGRPLLRFMPINLFGGLFAVAIGVGTIVAARRGSRALLLLCGVAFLGAAAVNLVGIGRSFNVFGGHASLASVFLGLGTGYVAIALTPELEAGERGDA